MLGDRKNLGLAIGLQNKSFIQKNLNFLEQLLKVGFVVMDNYKVVHVADISFLAQLVLYK